MKPQSECSHSQASLKKIKEAFGNIKLKSELFSPSGFPGGALFFLTSVG